MFGKTFWHYRELKIDCWTSRHILCQKILISFACVEFRILVEKWNVYGHIFQRPFLQTCRMDTTSLCLNNRINENKLFQILIIFIELNINVWPLCAHPVMKSIILHTRIPNLQLTWFYVSFDFLFFAFWGAEMNVFHISTICPLSMF